MQRRWTVGISLATVFHLIIFKPAGYLTLNYIFGAGGIIEYTSIQRGILMRVFEKEDQTVVSSKLYRLLSERLSNKWMTLFLLTFYHCSVIMMPEEYCGFVMVAVFVAVIYIKIFTFNKFFRELADLCDRHKKNPEATQAEFDR